MRLSDDPAITHIGQLYDPLKAHEYYLRTRKLKGRKKGGAEAAKSVLGRRGAVSVSRGKQVNVAVRKKKLDSQIQDLSERLSKLNAELKKRMAAAKEGEAKSRKAAKEAAKPDTAAEKTKSAKRSKEWRAKNQQKVKNAAKERAAKEKPASKADEKTKAGDSESVKALKVTISKVKDALTAAKARRRALG